MLGRFGNHLVRAQALAAGLLVLVITGCSGESSDYVKPGGALAERGRVLYEAHCESCHGGATGGSLRDIPPPHNANGHTWHHADQQLIDMTLSGIPFSLEDVRMPAFKGKLTEDEVEAILAYIKTWWTEEQRQSQRNVTAQWDR